MSGFAPPLQGDILAGLVLLAMMIALVVAIAAVRNLLAAVLMMSAYSLCAALWLVVEDAPDVGFTEAAVGGGASTVFMVGALLLAQAEEAKRRVRDMIAPGLAALAVGLLVGLAMTALPGHGDPASAVNTHVGRDYLVRTPSEIGAPNVVTAVLASYRGFDTLGETSVVFAAGLGVALLLGFGERAFGDLSRSERIAAELAMREDDYHVILRSAARLLIPLIAAFALYVMIHGDLSAGGGFQAGVILAAAVILHALVFGLCDTMEALSPAWVRACASLGVLIYAGVGVVNLLNGGVFLDYDFLFPHAFVSGLPDAVEAGGDYHYGQHYGILIIEAGVMLTVASTMIAIFYGFAGRAHDIDGDGQYGSRAA
jgi:multicomponent Na+:H+ antiporter subunit B